MKYKITISSTAKTDLLEIWDYIAEDNFDAADKTIAEINKKILSLDLFPNAGAPRNEIEPNLRALFCGNYGVYYFVNKQVVEIQRILHTSRDVYTLFN